LTGASITDVPQQIYNDFSLDIQDLSLSFNQISTFPTQLYLLANLTALDLSGNQLEVRE